MFFEITLYRPQVSSRNNKQTPQNITNGTPQTCAKLHDKQFLQPSTLRESIESQQNRLERATTQSLQSRAATPLLAQTARLLALGITNTVDVGLKDSSDKQTVTIPPGTKDQPAD